MKKQVFLLAMLIYVSLNVYGQNCTDPVITDFECAGPSHPTPNTNLETVANPYMTGINTSAHVGKFTDNGTDAWDNLLFDYGTSEIDLSTNHFFKIKVYNHTGLNPVTLKVKLEGGSSPAKEVDATINNTDVWTEYAFDFSSEAANHHKKIVLFFNAGATNGTNADEYYIDDLRWDKDATVASVNEFVLSQVQVFPNPTKGIININTDKEIDAYTITDLTGKVIMKSVETETLNRIDISALKDGYYFLNLMYKDAQRVVKILKQ